VSQDKKRPARACSYNGRGVFVPPGMEAAWVMEGASVLERNFGAAPFISRQMVRAVLEAVIPLMNPDRNEEPGSATGVS
jgi:hypothetical protein